MNRSAYRSAALTTLLGVALAGTALAQTAPMPGAGMTHHGPGGMHHEGGMHRARMLKQIDTDGDGQISRAELDAAHEAMRARSTSAFEAADSNRDGKLSQDEMRAYHQAMRPPGGPGAPGGRSQRPDGAAPARPGS